MPPAWWDQVASPENVAQAVPLFVAADYLPGKILLADDGLNLT